MKYFNKVLVRLIVDDKFIIKEHGIYKGVTFWADKLINIENKWVYIAELYCLETCKHNNSGKKVKVYFQSNEVREIMPLKKKVANLN